MIPKTPTYIVDSFTDESFKGNPAGVCIIQNTLEIHQMFSIAKELGLSETAFVKKTTTDHTYTIRYFSPKVEIPLCGHATLASAKVLFEEDKSIQKLTFITIENIKLIIEKIEDGYIKMIFPVYDTVPAKPPKELLNALGIDKIENSVFNKETKILLLEINSSIILQNLTPDFTALYNSHKNINGVLVTSLSLKEKYDFESRYFWPWTGTNEDPVTGGTHTFLSKYWAKKLNKTKLNSFQCSKRTGFMEIELLNKDKLSIKSTAKIIFRGYLN